MTGVVYLVGAGPGDPELLTLRAARVLGRADVVVVDALVSPEVLALARADAEIVHVGKIAGEPSTEQAAINGLLVARGQAGLVVVRLKGGDPFIFGRGGEEAEVLTDAGVRYEVVPGVSAGTAAAAYAGIPLVHRQLASTVTFTTGHLGHVAAHETTRGQTLVIFMCGRALASIGHDLLGRGWARETPIAVIERATRQDQRVVTGTLDELVQIPAFTPRRPAIAVVGAVAGLAARLHWFGSAPMGLREGDPFLYDATRC